MLVIPRLVTALTLFVIPKDLFHPRRTYEVYQVDDKDPDGKDRYPDSNRQTPEH